MKNKIKCEYCSKGERKGLRNLHDFVCETKYWEVYLSYNQCYLGRCIIALKRHSENLSDLNKKEWEDFAKLIRRMESALKKAFDATMFNWTCLMNSAYKSKKPNPHVHWYFGPRYNHEVKFAGAIFKDLEFGKHYSIERAQIVKKEVCKKIIQRIKECLE